jgi:hypothetical protein
MINANKGILTLILDFLEKGHAMKTMLFRKLALCIGLIALLGLGLWGGVPAAAQGSPSQPVLDEIFRQLSTRIGIPVSTMRLDGFYTFEEVVVNNNNLGCPNLSLIHI